MTQTNGTYLGQGWYRRFESHLLGDVRQRADGTVVFLTELHLTCPRADVLDAEAAAHLLEVGWCYLGRGTATLHLQRLRPLAEVDAGYAADREAERLEELEF